MILQKKKTNKESSDNTIDSIVYWLKVMAVGFIVSLLALLFVGWIARNDFQEQRANDKKQQENQRLYDNEQDAKQLASRITEGCLNFNRKATVDRIAAHEKIVALADFADRPLDLSNPIIIEKFQRYDARMAELYSYHHCDSVCAVSYTDKDIPDCPPSDNEEGT